MDDRVYRAKYEEGAEKGDIQGKLKQAIDARHTEGLKGWYLSGGTLASSDSERFFIGAEVGYENYLKSYLSNRVGATLFHDGDQGFGGLDFGVRLQSPTRLSPFVGAGWLNGVSKGVRDASGDGADNDEDGLFDEPGEKENFPDAFLTAVYPEVGLHFWANGSGRATFFGRYLITSDGRDSDHWLLGGQVTIFQR